MYKPITKKKWAHSTLHKPLYAWYFLHLQHRFVPLPVSLCHHGISAQDPQKSATKACPHNQHPFLLHEVEIWDHCCFVSLKLILNLVSDPENTISNHQPLDLYHNEQVSLSLNRPEYTF